MAQDEILDKRNSFVVVQFRDGFPYKNIQVTTTLRFVNWIIDSINRKKDHKAYLYVLGPKQKN